MKKKTDIPSDPTPNLIKAILRINPGKLFLKLDDFGGLWWLAVFLVPIIYILNPPNGLLNTNEEHYFRLAALWSSGELADPLDALFGGIDHIFVFSTVTGWLIEIVGYEAAQVLGRSTIALIYPFAIARLFSGLNVTVLEGLLIVLIFAALGQDIIGGGWIFGGFEPKTLAYPIVIFGLSYGLQGPTVKSICLFALATYCHFLVGGYWMMLTLGAWLLNGTELKTAFRLTAIYVVICMPLLLFIASSHLDVFQDDLNGNGESAGIIIKYFMAPFHVAPFANIWQFRVWAPGILAILPMLILAVAVLRDTSNEQRILVLLSIASLFWLIIALVVSLIDKNGAVAAFGMFRPSSIALLIWISVIVCYLRERFRDQSTASAVKTGALLLIGMVAGPSMMENALAPFFENNDNENEIYDFAKTTEPNVVFLLDPAVDGQLISFERRTSRHTLISHQFTPYRTEEIFEWKRRYLFRESVLRCDDTEAYPVDFVIRNAGRRLACATLVFENSQYALFRRD